MPNDDQPRWDSRYARLIAGELFKQSKDFQTSFQQALDSQQTDQRAAANEERNQLKAARARVVGLIPNFPLESQDRLKAVIATVDTTLKTCLPFSPFLEEDESYLADFLTQALSVHGEDDGNSASGSAEPPALEDEGDDTRQLTVPSGTADAAGATLYHDAKSGNNSQVSFPSIPDARAKTSTPRSHFSPRGAAKPLPNRADNSPSPKDFSFPKGPTASLAAVAARKNPADNMTNQQQKALKDRYVALDSERRQMEREVARMNVLLAVKRSVNS